MEPNTGATSSFSEGTLQNHFLVAMPGMRDERFSGSVIYLCAHGDDGAMGLIINRTQQLGFTDVLVELGIVERSQSIRLPAPARNMAVRSGGPVDRSRGFVLHSGDYVVDSSMAVSEHICLTATVDILRDISSGRGPRQALMALGYSGWGAGQLEAEIAENGWLACPATPELLFENEVDSLYDRILGSMGIDPTHLSHLTGHA
ncbi:YqgE/AlgH family protein [Chelativorans sp. YIM 93263]|uniref:YqgE/AlgH family protein n=1 Tax=Chelativorans sp. YIM 93263 TaxID=2906648 RepID=UPI00237846E6|nr:YqgE/AlgH family protein [Chelativorans sp. YIM 93263]